MGWMEYTVKVVTELYPRNGGHVCVSLGLAIESLLASCGVFCSIVEELGTFPAPHLSCGQKWVAPLLERSDIFLSLVSRVWLEKRN